MGGAPPGAPTGTPPGGGATGAAPPSTGAPPAGPSETAPAEAPKLTEEEKTAGLEAFKKVDSRDILRKRLEEADKQVTKVDPEKGVPYPGVGRIDPLTFVDEAIPEELRPPRSGETDIDKVLEYLMAAWSTEIIEQVHIRVFSVMKIGLETWVNLEVDTPYYAPVSGALRVGGAMHFGDPTGRGMDIDVYLDSADQKLVTFTIYVGSISKTKSFVPGAPSGPGGGVGGGGGPVGGGGAGGTG